MLQGHAAAIRHSSRRHMPLRGGVTGAGPQCGRHIPVARCKTRLTARALGRQHTLLITPPRRYYTPEEKAFVILKGLTPVCAADIATPASGVRGLVASTKLLEGQTVLFVPSTNSLSVPIGGAASVTAWHQDVLQPWEQRHRPLPGALVDFIADTHWDSTTRLAAWLLYLRRYCTGSSSNSSRLWQSWLTLLPGTDEATNACGLWSHAELQQLQLEPFKGMMTAINSLTAAVCREAFNHMQTGALGRLQLADSVDDVMWGAFVARTRATSTGDAVTLRPMHDMLNHAEHPNASCCETDNGYAIEALTDIPAGTEITISYTGDEPLGSDLDLGTPSLELLMTWGFTLAPSVQDVILPMQYQALPALDRDTLVAAAAAVVMQPPHGGHEGVNNGKMQLMNMVQAAVANMPVAQSSSGSSSGSSSRVSTMYKRAADTVGKFGMLGSGSADPGSKSVMLVSSNNDADTAAAFSQLPKAGSSSSKRVSSLDTEAQQMPEWLVYERPYLTQLQLRKMQSQFMSDVITSLPPLRRSVLAASVPGSVGCLAQLPLAYLQWLSKELLTSVEGTISRASKGHGSSSSSSNSNSMQQMVEQSLVARALSCEVQHMLLQCSTTVNQDEAVWQFLQQYNEAKSADPYYPTSDRVCMLAQQKSQEGWQVPASFISSSGGHSRGLDTPCSEFVPVAVAASGATAGGTPWRAHQQLDTLDVQGFKQRQLDIVRQLMLLNAGNALEAALRAGPAADVAAVLATALGPKHQKFTSSAHDDITAMAMTASTAVLPGIQAVTPVTSSTSSTGLTADWTAASGSNIPSSLAAPLKVLTALSAASRTGSYFFNIPPSVQAISAALSQQEQQLAAWQKQQSSARSAQYATATAAVAGGCDAAVAEAAGLLRRGQACKARMMTAVAARLQHKRLLHIYDEMMRQVQRQLNTKLTIHRGSSNKKH